MEAMEALADPTRRRIVELLATGEKSAGELAEAFTVSRPAVSRHLRVLREAELVTSEARAQRRIYRLNDAPLEALDHWLTNLRADWANRLDALETELERGRRNDRNRPPRPGGTSDA